MKHQYKINSYSNERGEAFTAIYCADLYELAVESSGLIVCTEQDALEDVLAGTPWAGRDDLTFADEWPVMAAEDYDRLSSDGLRGWIDAKE